MICRVISIYRLLCDSSRRSRIGCINSLKIAASSLTPLGQSAQGYTGGVSRAGIVISGLGKSSVKQRHHRLFSMPLKITNSPGANLDAGGVLLRGKSHDQGWS